jgi:hypothetical protein
MLHASINSVKIIKYILIQYNEIIQIVGISDLLQYLFWGLLFPVTYDKQMNVFVGW